MVGVVTIGYGHVRSWLPGSLDEADLQLRNRSDHLVALADELATAGVPDGWVGDAAAAADARRSRVLDGLEHIVAGANAARGALMVAADEVVGLRHLIAEAEALCLRHNFTISDAGTVVDGGRPGPVAPSQAVAVAQERATIRAELEDRVSQILRRATEIDDDLAGVLGRVERGEITDGGADSLTDAAVAGLSQGAEVLGVPGPPPDPPTDPGAGEHGSDSWWTTGDDRVMAALARDAANAADTIGWTHAATHLHHYLNNSGDDLTVSPDQMMRDVDQFRDKVEDSTADEMRRIAAEAAANGSYGRPVQFSTGWQDHYLGPDESKDWYYAMGGVQYAVTGVATVHPPVHPGGEPRIEMDYQTHVFDRYNWDQGKSTEIGPITIDDSQLAEMHRAGVAQEFDMSGSTDTKHYTGDVPQQGESPSLPDPADNRDGTRTDPGREAR